MKNAYGYIRVSRDRDRDKLSPEVQRRRIQDYCRAKRWQLAKVVEDLNVSGGDFDRPGWQALLGQLGPGDIIVCNEFTRIGRNLRQTLGSIEELHEVGVEIVSLEGELDTTTAAGKLQYQVLLVLAEFERNRMSERLRQTHDQIAREGRWKGGPLPLGYTYTPGTKVLTVHPEEAEVVREIFRMRDSDYGMHVIVRELAARGIKGKKGRMNYSSVVQTLRNPTYLGKRAHNGEILNAGHEPIIDADQWERVQARNRLKVKGASHRKYLLSGLLVCGECGARMVHRSSGNRAYYVCKEAQQFQNTRRVTIESHLAHDWVLERFFARLNDGRVQAAQQKAKKRAPARMAKTAELRRQLERVEAATDRLITDYYDDPEPLLTPEQFRKKNAELREKRAGIARELQELEDRARLDNVIQITRGQLREIKDSWSGMTVDEQREAISLFIDHVTVKPRRGSKKCDPGRVVVRWKW